MKKLLIAAGMAAAMLFAAPALAAPAPAGNGVQMSSPQDMRDGMRDGRRDDRGRMDRRGNGDRSTWTNNGRGNRDGRWNNSNRGNRWGNKRWCHNVRRHHRWVRVCGRR